MVEKHEGRTLPLSGCWLFDGFSQISLASGGLNPRPFIIRYSHSCLIWRHSIFWWRHPWCRIHYAIHFTCKMAIVRKAAESQLMHLLRARPKAERVSLELRGKIWVWAAGRPAGRPWSRFWRAYISATTGRIDKRFSVVGSCIPSAVNGTNINPSGWPLWHMGRAEWGDVTKNLKNRNLILFLAGSEMFDFWRTALSALPSYLENHVS